MFQIQSVMEDLYHFSEFSFSAVEDKLSSSNDIFWATDVGLKEMKKVQFSGAEESGGIESLCSNFGFFPDDPSEEEEEEGYILQSPNQQKYHPQQQQHPPSYNYELLDNLHFDMVSSPLQNITQFDEVQYCPTTVPLCDPKKNKKQYQYPTPLPLAPVEILKNYGKGFKRLRDEGKILHPVEDLALVTKKEDGKKLSTEDVMKIAGTKFIQSSSSESASGLLDHPFGFSFSGLSEEEKEDVELAESLLACAEKVGYQQFERANKLLCQIESLSSKTGNPVKRVVHYFAEALRQRIDLETGRVSAKELQKIQSQSLDPEEVTKDINPTMLAFYEELPFCQVTVFTAVQAVIENVNGAKKIHIIDLEIRKGLHWTILMQALESRHECPLEILKITAVVSGNTSKQVVEDTGKRLKDFAHSLKNITFSFNTVNVSDLLRLREDHFEIEPEETVVVYSPYALRSKIQQSDQLETVMRVVRTINPVVMVVAEIEANHNSTSFVNRFIEALFYFSAFFDCFEDCMKCDEENRVILESLYFSPGIRNIVAAEGAERKTRNVKIDVWRAFFSRFGMVETELSMITLYHADLVAKRFPCGVTFDMNGHCFLIGWKGTPINSVSVWKFI